MHFTITVFITAAVFVKLDAQSLPSFTMQLTNGKTIDSKDMLSRKPLLLVYFSPDCEHCQKLIREMLSKIDMFKRTNILLVTFFPLKDAINFERDYNIKSYANISVAKETQPLYLRKYYNLQHTPFTALFNAKGALEISYKDETPIDDLLKHINK